MRVNPGIFKAYDIRGIYPDDLNEDIAHQVGRAFATFLKPETWSWDATCGSLRRYLARLANCVDLRRLSTNRRLVLWR